jgi:mannosyltransferase OCH1-like enzyme
MGPSLQHHDKVSRAARVVLTRREGEKIPRIIHQTWKSDVLPEKWRKAFRECREGMPDYEYMLWTDELSLQFIKEHYPAQLQMFESYAHPIQRADAIRYFILHHFGGIYMDLDIGCRRRMDPLLQGDWEVLLAVTKPVGVSNDLIFSSKGSAFMDDTVHGLAAFNHWYVMHYPTVMFSTGPMFLSAQLGIYSASHPVTPTNPVRQVRVLPKSLYGKNAPQSEVPHSFFSHFYGSSWHANDAGFITWLGKWGKGLMYVGAAVLAVMIVRLIWTRLRRKNGPQYMMLPVFEDGRSSPTSSGPLSPISDTPPALGDALRRAGNMILAAPAALAHGPGRRQKGWLYFVPWRQAPTGNRRRTASEASNLPRRPHSVSNSVSLAPLAYSDHPHAPPPPPYDAEMSAVDEFLKDNAEDEVSSQASGSASGSTGGGARQRDEWREGKWGDWRQD